MEQTIVPSGFLLADKPVDWTSFDVVNKVRHTLAGGLGVRAKSIKVGHSGTLDPKATGLLVLAIGSATKKLEKIVKNDKTYEVGSLFGATSTTGDSEGDITINQSAEQPSLSEVQDVVAKFVGEIDQTPHKFSAVKVDGTRAYKLARAGKKVELSSRKVTIYEIKDLSYRWPQLNFDAKVSSGTYIRSLVEDIGRDLGVGAYMSSLRRTEIGKFNVIDAVSVEDIDFQTIIDGLSPLD